MRLSTRIALAVGVLVPLLVLASGWIMVRLVTRDVHAQSDAHLRQRAAAVLPEARNLLRAMANDRPASVEQARQRRLFTSALDLGIRVTGPDGTVSGGPQPKATVTLPATAAALRPVTVPDGGRSWRVLAEPLSVTRPSVSGTLWLFSSDTAGQAQIGQVRRRILTVAVLTAPVAGLAAWATATRFARPLLALQRRAGGIDPRSSANRLEHTPTRIPEIDALARTLQTVLARYDEQAARTAEALATARSFSAAASHELRTPLMSMRINLDVLDGTPEPGREERGEIIADLRAEHERLLGLLVMLRTLAQGDLVEADAFAPVDLADLLEAAVTDLRRERPAARVAVDSAPGCVVHAWPPGLRSAVDNLLTNAALHGANPDGSARIEVVLRPAADPAALCLTVSDHGPGIPADARGEIFQRFRRGPDSPGSGLGLTLVAQQIALHGGTVTVTDRPDGTPGAHIAVLLPRPSAPHSLPTHRAWLPAPTPAP
ncbi:two-component system, OmpR family, sensor histidine kinase PrrB [Actinacidiphila rubida]|uniref:histidine kinase n=2 Tax=Actinacidiphila rubida TaxID=310780 RepID=A0A1H8JUU2_9ACTN|nr:HAMP domain-containing sensor histidine kinase [Actinacidiphila rubida]SEN84361.1 two-component system, OmpR family, sensor histidine kinase PrrB [Actinacidiphila rubida]